MLIALLLKALVIMFGLPALGLIAFHGGIIAAFFTAVIAGIFGVVLRWTLGGLAALEIFGGVLGGIATGGVGGGVAMGLVSLIVGGFLYFLALYASLWFAAAIVPGVVLLGFWKTVFSAVILMAVTKISHHFTDARKASTSSDSSSK